jgi:hypothetical protein
MDFLSQKEILATKWLLRRQPEKVIIVLDGPDEYKNQANQDITNIIKGNMFPGASIIITTRPEAASRAKNGNESSIKKHNL